MHTSVYEFLSQQANDPIIEWHTCPVSGEEFAIFQKDKDMIEKLSPSIGGQTFLLPLPRYAPSTRHRLQLMYKNERHLYHTACGLSGERIISRVHPDLGVTVYSNQERAGDNRNYTDYAMDYVGGNPLEYVASLAYVTPYQDMIGSLSNIENNANYTNYTADVVNCYLLFDSNTTEDSAYCTKSRKSQSVFDCHNIVDCEYCYECIDCDGMYESTHCYDSSKCANSHYLIDCHGCTNCIGCVNLTNKEYHIFNQAVGRETFLVFKQKLADNRWNLSHPHREQLKRHMIKKSTHQLNSENSWGENIRGSSDCFLSYNIVNAQDLRYCDDMGDAQDAWGVTSYGHASSRLYNSSQVGRYSTQIYCSATVGKSENLFYCIDTKKCKNCFGCVNIKQKEYCIFNKQYTREQYEALVPQLIASMQSNQSRGHFLPSRCSIFPYNDTLANDIYPIHTLRLSDGTEQVINPQGTGIVTLDDETAVVTDAVLDLGGTEQRPIKRRNQDSEINIPPGLVTIQTDAIPSLDEVDDSILEQAIICAVSARPFRIVRMELDFYRRMGLPLPCKHPDIRHAERIAMRSGNTLYLRRCDECGDQMVSVYPEQDLSTSVEMTNEGQGQKVYCESCYQRVVFG